MNPYELLIGLRYTRAKRRNQYISFISLSSMAGIALGVTALITVISVMNGFERELRERILSVVSHATVTGPAYQERAWQDVIELTKQADGVVAAAPYVHSEGMLTHGSAVNGSIIRGVDPALETQVSGIGEKLIQSEQDGLNALKPGEFGILLGRELAFALGVSLGDKVTLVSPQLSVTPVGVLPRLKTFTVKGVFQIGMHEYDSALALIHLADAQRLLRMGDAVTGVRIKVQDVLRAPVVARDLVERMPAGFYISDWTRQHANFFRAVQNEKVVMFIILMLIIAVAAFNIISTLVMVVTDKQSDIAVLRTMGASTPSVMAIFIIQGSVIGILGTLIGTVGGLLLAGNLESIIPIVEKILGIDLWDETVYYISELKADIRRKDVEMIMLISFAMSILATIFPSWQAAKTDPAEALRHE